ncbi:uncharacterized protein LOC113027348 isoform X4 [Astatotilapia calliptera]|uniref:uncharacterized protein LOC113027348 isoform X4 n=1 Tax=Astatotilapia calliptera TaxID=8154 RepID=UPI000E40D5D1|nr:uncharacterized protein LOC113027348 isoform X4 [Astatotilapia calliptera]
MCCFTLVLGSESEAGRLHAARSPETLSRRHGAPPRGSLGTLGSFRSLLRGVDSGQTWRDRIPVRGGLEYPRWCISTGAHRSPGRVSPEGWAQRPRFGGQTQMKMESFTFCRTVLIFFMFPCVQCSESQTAVFLPEFALSPQGSFMEDATEDHFLTYRYDDQLAVCPAFTFVWLTHQPVAMTIR